MADLRVSTLQSEACRNGLGSTGCSFWLLTFSVVCFFNLGTLCQKTHLFKSTLRKQSVSVSY